MSVAFRTSYEFSVGGEIRISRISWAGCNVAMTYENCVDQDVKARVRNWASTWTNQTTGSLGQKEVISERQHRQLEVAAG